jgi:hypothetical protein
VIRFAETGKHAIYSLALPINNSIYIHRCYGVYGILTAGKSLTMHYVFVNRNRTCPANMVLKTGYADLPSQQYPIPK